MILRAEPRPVPRIWGSLPGGREGPLGELWWIHHDDADSSVLTGPGGTGTTTLDRLVRSGRVPGGSRYPVMVKTLHTRERLSVQVHPGVSGGSLRKEETWIVLTARAGAWMMGGLLSPVDAPLLSGLSPEGAEQVLRRIPLMPGDVWRIPPGTVHALGPGLEVLEIQDNCDVTYRLYDWGRTGPDGKPRHLHLDEGLASIAPPPGGMPLREGARGRITADRAGGHSYGIRELEAPGAILLRAGELFFLAGGRLSADGEIHTAPVCLIAADDGGSIVLEEGIGYRVIPGGSPR